MWGAFTYICAPATIASFIVWLIVFDGRKSFRSASIAGAPVVPIVIWVLGEPWEYVAFSLAAALIVVVKHKENIERLLRGEENRLYRERRNRSENSHDRFRRMGTAMVTSLAARHDDLNCTAAGKKRHGIEGNKRE